MRYLISALLCFGLGSLIMAQKEALQIDKEAWENTVEGVNYDEQDAAMEEKEVSEEVSRDYNFNWNLDADIWRPLFFGLIIFIIVFILYRIIKNARVPAKVNTTRVEASSLEEAEENLPEVTLNNIYSEALVAEDFKAALRIRFLMILQKMIDHNLIVWKKQKTNEQFLNEITNHEIRAPFGSIVKVFDEVWYGNIRLSQQQFNEATQQIDSLNRRIYE